MAVNGNPVANAVNAAIAVSAAENAANAGSQARTWIRPMAEVGNLARR